MRGPLVRWMVSLKASFSSLRHDDVEWTRDELGEGCARSARTCTCLRSTSRIY
jgi:hypothetical protein